MSKKEKIVDYDHIVARLRKRGASVCKRTHSVTIDYARPNHQREPIDFNIKLLTPPSFQELDFGVTISIGDHRAYISFDELEEIYYLTQLIKNGELKKQ